MLADRTLPPTAARLVGLVAVSPVLVYYSSEFKQYQGDVLGTLLILWLTLRFRPDHCREDAFWLALAGAIGPRMEQRLRIGRRLRPVEGALHVGQADGQEVVRPCQPHPARDVARAQVEELDTVRLVNHVEVFWVAADCITSLFEHEDS